MRLPESEDRPDQNPGESKSESGKDQRGTTGHSEAASQQAQGSGGYEQADGGAPACVGFEHVLSGRQVEEGIPDAGGGEDSPAREPQRRTQGCYHHKQRAKEIATAEEFRMCVGKESDGELEGESDGIVGDDAGPGHAARNQDGE